MSRGGSFMPEGVSRTVTEGQDEGGGEAAERSFCGRQGANLTAPLRRARQPISGQMRARAGERTRGRLTSEFEGSLRRKFLERLEPKEDPDLPQGSPANN